MTWSIYKTDKASILKKLKEIGLDQQEDRKGPQDEMNKVTAHEEKFDGTDTEYFKTIYNEKCLSNREKHGSQAAPTKDVKAVVEEKK